MTNVLYTYSEATGFNGHCKLKLSVHMQTLVSDGRNRVVYDIWTTEELIKVRRHEIELNDSVTAETVLAAFNQMYKMKVCSLAVSVCIVREQKRMAILIPIYERVV